LVFADERHGYGTTNISARMTADSVANASRSEAS
jgi:hypothetical protein